MIQNVCVALIVACAAAYALWKFTPAAVRKRVVPKLVVLAVRGGASRELALRLESKLASAGACGSCNSCNACATDPAASPVPGEPTVALPARVIPIARERG